MRGVCHQPGAAVFFRITQIRFGTGGNSFDGCTPVVYQDFTPEVDPDLLNHSSDLVNRFRSL